MLNVEKLNALMDERGWGPGELEYQSGVSYDTIYKIRTTHRPRTSAEVVAKFAIAFKVSIEYLLDLTDSRSPKAIDLDKGLIELIDAAKRLSKARQSDLLLIAKAYESVGEPTAEVLNIVLEKVRELGGEEEYRKLLATLKGLLPGLPGDVDDDLDKPS